jgi:hypothetical protein
MNIGKESYLQCIKIYFLFWWYWGLVEQDLTLARQMLYRLSLSTSPLKKFFYYFL